MRNEKNVNAPTPPLIEVTIDKSGRIDYRLRTSLLSTQAYGQILATLAAQIAVMFEVEGGMKKEKVLAEIAGFFADEIVQPTAETSINQLQ